MDTKREICSCGFPQSHPIPHEHDRTDREKQIITHYESVNRDLYEACKWAAGQSHHPACKWGKSGAGTTCDCNIGAALKALAKAEGK